MTQVQRPCERIPMVEQEAPDEDGKFDPDQAADTGCIRHYQNRADTDGKGNDAFADGHVGTLSPEQVHDHPDRVHLFR